MNQALSPVLNSGLLSEGRMHFQSPPASEAGHRALPPAKDLYIRNIRKKGIQMLSSQKEDQCLLKSDKEGSKNDGSLT